MARSSTNKDTNCSHWRIPRLSAHSDTVRNGSHLHRSLILEGLRDLSELQITEVLHDRLFRKLEKGILL